MTPKAKAKNGRVENNPFPSKENAFFASLGLSSDVSSRVLHLFPCLLAFGFGAIATCPFFLVLSYNISGWYYHTIERESTPSSKL